MRSDLYLVVLFFLAAALFLSGCGTPDNLMTVGGSALSSGANLSGQPADCVRHHDEDDDDHDKDKDEDYDYEDDYQDRYARHHSGGKKRPPHHRHCE